MEAVLLNHQASKEVKEKAEAAGIDLEALKASNPQEYKMLCAQYQLELDKPLLDLCSAIFFALFPYYELFQIPRGSLLQLYTFPGLNKLEMDKLEAALSRLAEQPGYAKKNIFFRIITDQQGTHRQLQAALSSQNWQGQTNILVGPFQEQHEAKSWGDALKDNRSLLVDTVFLNGLWFCDVFRA